MQPKTVNRDQIKLVGMQYIGNNENGEIPQLWESFITRAKEIGGTINNRAFYGVCECICEGPCKCGMGGDFLYIAAVEVSEFDGVPEGMVTKTIPAAKYAVFIHKGSLDGLCDTMNSIYCKWIPESKITPNQKFCFEYYDERFDNSPNSELDIYVPVK